jgi:tRNA(Ile)-lysidine synthase
MAASNLDPQALHWTTLHAAIHSLLKTKQLLPQTTRILVAVSGGQDSLCLLRLLLDLQPKWEWELAIAHCDHGWHGDVGNADFVQQIAITWNLPFHLVTATELPETEAAARQWRYAELGTIAQQHHFPFVVTGHTASDRAETLLYNLMRGSGADGLQAMTWTRALTSEIQLVRPLLNVTRAETGNFCQQRNILIWQDPANQDLRFARSRIRQELLPYLSTHFNPQLETTLAQTAELLQADVEYLETEAAKLLQAALDSVNLKLHCQTLRQAPLALQRRSLRQFLQAVLPTDPNFEQVEKLLTLVTAPNRAQTDPFSGGAIAQVNGDWIELGNREQGRGNRA